MYEGYYGPSPNYQQGTPPYAQAGGSFVFSGGKPVLQNTFPQQFCLVVPSATKCPMPASGYPIVLYAHGTGGDYRSVVDEGHSFGDLMAQQCMASMGINQIFSGQRARATPARTTPTTRATRTCSSSTSTTPWPRGPTAGRAAVDVVQQARLFTDTHVDRARVVSRTPQRDRLRRRACSSSATPRAGSNGPLFLAGDGQARGGVLSGSGAMITVALLEKTPPSRAWPRP